MRHLWGRSAMREEEQRIESNVVLKSGRQRATGSPRRWDKIETTDSSRRDSKQRAALVS
jgi:hypothetical protein